MNKNDIVAVVTMAGEFVGKFDSFEGEAVKLNDPRMIVQGPEGQMGFAKGICQTGKMEPDNAVINNYIFIHCRYRSTTRTSTGQRPMT